jgi:uncharacterized protein (TIGR00255 family)
MKSMTGYGKSTYIDENYEIEFEIKSVNNKVFLLDISCFKDLQLLENEIRDLVYKFIKRGKVSLRIHLKTNKLPEITIDESRVKVFIDLLSKIRDEHLPNAEIKLESLLGQPGLIQTKHSDLTTDLDFKKIFFDTLSIAVKKQSDMAIAEGEVLKKYFTDAIVKIEDNLQKISETIPTHKEKLAENLTKNVKIILDKNYENDMEKRILLEVALYIEKCDITEEIVRLKSHIENFKSNLCKTNEEIGKTLNFILQEMQREANTISSKYTTSNTFQYVLSVKEEIEKCREQIQNIE